MSTQDLESRVTSLEAQLQEYQKRLAELEDIEAIQRLQRAYNYYIERMMGNDVIDCFADSPDVMLDWLEGKWLGKEGVRKYFERAARKKDPPGFSHQLMPIAGIITLDPDGKTASGRWYAFGAMFTAIDGKIDSGAMVNGIYEIRYIKEDGIWKILSIYWYIPYSWRTSEGWNTPEDLGRRFIKLASGEIQEESTRPDYKRPIPDIPLDPSDLRFISGFIPPHHFKHPVTGKTAGTEEHNSRLEPLKLD